MAWHKHTRARGGAVRPQQQNWQKRTSELRNQVRKFPVSQFPQFHSLKLPPKFASYYVPKTARPVRGEAIKKYIQRGVNTKRRRRIWAGPKPSGLFSHRYRKKALGRPPLLAGRAGGARTPAHPGQWPIAHRPSPIASTLSSSSYHHPIQRCRASSG